MAAAAPAAVGPGPGPARAPRPPHLRPRPRSLRAVPANATAPPGRAEGCSAVPAARGPGTVSVAGQSGKREGVRESPGVGGERRRRGKPLPGPAAAGGETRALPSSKREARGLRAARPGEQRHGRAAGHQLTASGCAGGGCAVAGGEGASGQLPPLGQRRGGPTPLILRGPRLLLLSRRTRFRGTPTRGCGAGSGTGAGERAARYSAAARTSTAAWRPPCPAASGGSRSSPRCAFRGSARRGGGGGAGREPELPGR